MGLKQHFLNSDTLTYDITLVLVVQTKFGVCIYCKTMTAISLANPSTTHSYSGGFLEVFLDKNFLRSALLATLKIQLSIVNYNHHAVHFWPRTF